MQKSKKGQSTAAKNSAKVNAVFERGIEEIFNEENSMLNEAIADGMIEDSVTTSTKKTVKADQKKEELYQFIIHDEEDKLYFTDYGTKEQMQSLLRDAFLRMCRFADKVNINEIQSYKNDEGFWCKVYNWDDWNRIHILYQKVGTYNSRSKRYLSAEMNDYFKKYAG